METSLTLPNKLSLFQLYWKPVLQVILLYTILSSIFWSSYLINDVSSTEYAVWTIVLRSFALITLPTTVLILFGMSVPPLPVQVEKITDWQTPLVIRWTTRGIYPILVKNVITKTAQNLYQYRHMIRLELVTETAIMNDCWPEGYANQELVLPNMYNTKNNSLYKARALQYGVEYSCCADNSYILHLDEESIVGENLFLGVRQFISEHNSYIGQGIITYANTGTGWQSVFSHLADALRTGDDFARFRFQSLIHCNLVGMKGSFMLIPQEIEKTVGFDHGPQSSITEDAYFAFCNWDKVRWCSGVLEEQSPFSILDTIKQRRRWASGLWKLLLYHPCVWYRKLFLFLQMSAWVLSPLVVVSFITSFVLRNYWMPPVLSYLLTFNFLMFNFQYCWGCAHLIFDRMWKRVLSVVMIPLLLPIFLLVEGTGGVLGTFFPMSTFQLVQKESIQIVIK